MMFGVSPYWPDPVTASITPRGKLVFGTWSGYWFTLFVTLATTLTGVAFAILLSNICVPLIDHYIPPSCKGHFAKGSK